MINLEEEKTRITEKLSDQYSKNIINLEEYERLLDYVNKIETSKEVAVINNAIQENNAGVDSEMPALPYDNSGKNLTVFSWRTTNIKPKNGNGGKFTSVFGTNRIIIDDLPRGKTVLNIESIFGLTEIVVSQKVKIINKIVPLFSGVFIPDEINDDNDVLPELYLLGKAVFGNVTVIRKKKSQIASAIKRLLGQ